MIRKIKRYGWKPQLPDLRDWILPAKPFGIQLPSSVDLRPTDPPIYDQGELGSCTANAIGAAVQRDIIGQKEPDFMPSRLFIYYNERAMEGDVNTDGGAQIRDGFKSIAQQGVCSELEWPYDPSRFAVKPMSGCYTDALLHRALSYYAVPQTDTDIKGCLADGFGIVFGFTVYESFESAGVAATGIMPMPGPNEGVVGGHAVVAIGYDELRQNFLIRNSWGTGWGMKGYFWMPYAYLLDGGLCSDFWSVRKMA